MSRMKRYGWVGTGFLTLTAAVSLFTTKQADAQWHSSPAPVKVVNDLSLVGDVGTPHRQPFQGTFFVQIENGEFTASASFTPPAGKQLVINVAAFAVQLPADQEVVRAAVDALNNGQRAVMPIVVQLQGSILTTLGARHNFAGSQRVGITAQGGIPVQLSWTRSGSSGVFIGVFTFTGYTVDNP